MNALVKHEPIPIPDLARGRTPSLPAWLVSQQGAVAQEFQIMDMGFQEVQTLPTELMPTPQQREEMENHVRFLNLRLNETPLQSQNWEASILATVTKLLMTLGGDKRSDLAAEAKGEAYLAALDDVPWWAVEAAARCWYRGECGMDEQNRPFDYKWPPDPATLRNLAMRQVFRTKGDIYFLQKVIDARPFVDCSKEMEFGRLAMRGLLKTIGEGDALKNLTFKKANEIGAKLPPFKGEAVK